MDLFNAFYGEGKDFFEERKCGSTAYEIAHQPLMWRALGAYLKEMKPRIDAFMDRVGCLSDVRVILTGAGSSGFVGRAVSGFAAQAMGVHSEAIHTTDIVSAPDMHFPASMADKRTLLISFARSGNSPESVGAVQYARKRLRDLYEIAIVCDGKSKLAIAASESENGLVLVMPEGTNDNGFAMTSSVSTMILAGFAALCHKETDKIADEINVLADHVSGGSPNAMVNAARQCASWGFERAWYLGSGPMSALVQEGALKMMELTNGRVVAGCNSATEFRHGPKTVLNPKTLTVHFISNHPFTEKYDLDLFNELYGQRDGNKAVALQNAANPLQSDLTVPYNAAGYGICADVAAGLQGLIFMQLLSMFTSLALGVPTDNPSPSGLVNRVVQGVTVYPC
ncbi:MAG: SIS domain-containing protein [Defluviitaleaceae bacterium]|nr:SIS domain-containing protein [Defluviitaleaceae bacterium]